MTWVLVAPKLPRPSAGENAGPRRKGGETEVQVSLTLAAGHDRLGTG